MAIVGTLQCVCAWPHIFLDSTNNLQNKVALSFVNDQAASTHGNIHVDSIFLSPSGEWRLGGFEVLSNPKDEGAILYVRRPGHATATPTCSNLQQTLGTLLPDPNTYAPPEVKSGGWSVLKRYMV